MNGRKQKAYIYKRSIKFDGINNKRIYVANKWMNESKKKEMNENASKNSYKVCVTLAKNFEEEWNEIVLQVNGLSTKFATNEKSRRNLHTQWNVL